MVAKYPSNKEKGAKPAGSQSRAFMAPLPPLPPPPPPTLVGGAAAAGAAGGLGGPIGLAVVGAAALGLGLGWYFFGDLDKKKPKLKRYRDFSANPDSYYALPPAPMVTFKSYFDMGPWYHVKSCNVGVAAVGGAWANLTSGTVDPPTCMGDANGAVLGAGMWPQDSDITSSTTEIQTWEYYRDMWGSPFYIHRESYRRDFPSPNVAPKYVSGLAIVGFYPHKMPSIYDPVPLPRKAPKPKKPHPWTQPAWPEAEPKPKFGTPVPEVPESEETPIEETPWPEMPPWFVVQPGTPIVVPDFVFRPGDRPGRPSPPKPGNPPPKPDTGTKPDTPPKPSEPPPEPKPELESGSGGGKGYHVNTRPPSHKDVRPRKREKERKLSVYSRWYGVAAMGAANLLTESADLVDALHKGINEALPAKDRRKCEKKDYQCRLEHIYDHWDDPRVDVAAIVVEVINNQIEDYVYGRLDASKQLNQMTGAVTGGGSTLAQGQKIDKQHGLGEDTKTIPQLVYDPVSGELGWEWLQFRTPTVDIK